MPWLVGGSADLAPSNKTYLSGAGDIGRGAFAGRNFHFGIRELAMTAIVNGMVLVTRNTADFEPMREYSPLQLENWFSA